MYFNARSTAHEFLYGMLQIKGYTFLNKMLVYKRSCGEIYRRHYLISHLYDGNRGSGVMQILGHLKSDEASTYNNGTLDAVTADIFLNLICIVDVAESEHSVDVDSFKRRTHRRSSRRKKKTVVALTIYFSICTAHFYAMSCRIDGENFTVDTYVNIELTGECFRRMNKKTFTVGNCSSYIIRKSAIGIGNVMSALKDYDFCLLVCTSDSCGRCSSSCYSSNNYMLHIIQVYISLLFYCCSFSNGNIFYRNCKCKYIAFISFMQIFQWKLIIFYSFRSSGGI